MTRNDATGDGEERAETTLEAGVDLGKIRQDTADIRNAVAFAERSGGGRVSLELDHAIDELSAAVERLERAHAAAGAAGNVATETFEAGERVFVAENNGGEVIVLDTPNVRAKDYLIPETGETVADYNAKHPECSPSDPVVEVVFVEAIEAAYGNEWTIMEILDLYESAVLEDDVDRYAYPDSRLTTENPAQS